MSYLLTAVICGWVLLASGAPALNNKLENNQLPDNDHLGLNRYQLPNFSSVSSDVDIEKTINQVEQILKLNPQLPRLTRGEILYLLKNITSEDNIKAQDDAESIVGSNISNDQGKTKGKNNKMTMVVLPYKTEDTSNGDVTELFTKAPIVTFETPSKSKPIIVPDDDSEEAEDNQEYKNHKYSNGNSKSTTKTNGSNGKNPSNDFWKNQAQKVMEDLEKQNQPKKIVLDIPFKKMPDVEIPVDFSTNNDVTNDLQSINKLLGESQDDSVSAQSNGAFKPLALYDFKSLPEPITNFELILPNDGNGENLVAHSSSSFVDNKNKPKNGNTYVPPEEIIDGYKSEEKSDYSIAPKLDTSAYMSFKPLPTDDSINGDSKNLDIDEILQKYGIADSLNNMYLPAQSNSSSTNGDEFLANTDFIEDDMFPASMTSILTDMGLTKKKGRKMNGDNEKVDSYSYNAPPAIDTKYGLDPMNDAEMNGIYESLNMIKREMDEEQTEAVVKEVKNGENKDSSEKESKNDDESTTEKDSSETDTETNGYSKGTDNGPSLAALEDSFGASPADKDPSEAVLPPPRRNGFYYMVDWNSFLEVGEEGNSRRVNIRFEPKLGDPQMFVFGNKNN